MAAAGINRRDILISYIAAFGEAPSVDDVNTWLNDPSITDRETAYQMLSNTQKWQTVHGTKTTYEQWLVAYAKNLFNVTLAEADYAIEYYADAVNGTKAVPITDSEGFVHNNDSITPWNVHFYIVEDVRRGFPANDPMLLFLDGALDTFDAKYEVAEVISNTETGTTHNYYDYDQEAWITGTSGLTYSDYSLSDITSKSEAALKIDAITFTPADFETEYTRLYKKLLSEQMGTIDADDSILNNLFALIDAETDITSREKLSMKSKAYMQMLGSITSSSQQLSLQLVDKKHKFESEIKATTASTLKIVNEADFIKTKEEVMLQQVIDNRRIRAMDSMGDTFSTGMAGGLVPTTAMWNEYFRIGKELTRNELQGDELIVYAGTWSPTNATSNLPAGEVHDGSGWSTATPAAKSIGRYWIVDLSGWTRSYPENKRYNEATKPDSYTGTDAEYQASIRWTGTDELEYTISEDGTTILVTQIGTPIPINKTDIPGSLCSIPLDGVNYWRHGDIVYVKGIIGTATSLNEIESSGNLVTTGIVVHTYRRIAGLAAGTTVTTAADSAVEDIIIEAN